MAILSLKVKVGINVHLGKSGLGLLCLLHLIDDEHGDPCALLHHRGRGGRQHHGVLALVRRNHLEGGSQMSENHIPRETAFSFYLMNCTILSTLTNLVSCVI